MHGLDHHSHHSIHTAALHHQHTTGVAHRQLQEMHDSAARQHVQGRLKPQPAVPRMRRLGRLIVSVLDAICGV
jgi:hypothetical protein